MTRCLHSTSHYLIQCWPRSMSPYGITRPHWGPHWWYINLGGSNGLLSSSNKPLPPPILTNFLAPYEITKILWVKLSLQQSSLTVRFLWDYILSAERLLTHWLICDVHNGSSLVSSNNDWSLQQWHHLTLCSSDVYVCLISSHYLRWYCQLDP